MKKILVVEDDRDINTLVTKYLKKEGFAVHAARNGEEAFSLIDTGSYHLIILDLMLPGTDGYDILRHIRKKATTPVIILSAKDRETDKILGLELGADDYLTKPFTIGELMARVKALLRRSLAFGRDVGEDVLTHNSVELNRSTFMVTVAGEAKSLTAKEFAILRLFLENPARVFTKTQIFEAVWREESFSDDNTVMVHINRLRAKIERDPSNPVLIQTVWGFGYKLGG